MTETARSNPRPEVALGITLMIVAALYFGREIFIPIAVAGFLSVLLWPLVRVGQRMHLPRLAAVGLVVLVAAGVLGGIGWVVTQQAGRVIESLPRHRDELVEKVRHWREALPGKLSQASETVKAIKREMTGPSSQPASSPDSEPADSVGAAESKAATQPIAESTSVAGEPRAQEPVKVEVVAPAQDLLLSLGGLIGPLLNPLLKSGLTLIFTLFFLLYQNDLRDRVIRLCGLAHVSVTTSALADAGTRITRYVGAQAMANTLFGTAIGIGLLCIGMPDAFLWGLAAALLRFVPYIGTAVAAAAPTLMSVALPDSGFKPLLIAAWFVIVDVLIANFFEPGFFGGRVGASPTAILLGFVFWGWLWGGIGVFLATPITVCLVVLGKHVPGFRGFYILLGNEPVLDASTRFYQRLLALDASEALAIVKEHAATTSPAKAFDEVVLPALAQLEDDRYCGVVDAERIEHTRKALEQMLADMELPAAAPDGPASPAPVPAVGGILCLLDQGEYDLTVVHMVEQLLNGSAPHLEVLSARSLTSEIVDLVQTRRPRIVFIATVGPRHMARVELIVRRLSEVAPETRLLVGLVPRPGRSYRRLDRIDRTPNTRVLGSIVEMVNELKIAAVAT